MAYNPTYSMQPPGAARPYHTYSFQIKPVTSVSSNLPAAPRHSEPFQGMDGLTEPGSANHQGALASAPMDWVINILRLEKHKHSEALTALQSSCKSNLQLENLLAQERAFNYNLRVKAQEAEMERIFVQGQLRAYTQQGAVCNLMTRKILC
jgi:hypothetical protein